MLNCPGPLAVASQATPHATSQLRSQAQVRVGRQSEQLLTSLVWQALQRLHELAHAVLADTATTREVPAHSKEHGEGEGVER